MNSPAKLTDTQFAISVRGVTTQGSLPHPAEDPESRRGAEGRDQASKAGLVREIKAKTGMEAWRRDEETGQAYSLKLTDAGLKAIAADERGSQSIPSTAVPQNTNEDSSKAKTAANMAAARSATAAPTATAPRQGTKIARVIELLQRDQGAKLDELIAATGWLPHTARAALTGLRHRGYGVRLERGETGRASVYRAVANFRGQRVIPMRSSSEELDAAVAPHGRTAAGSLDQNAAPSTPANLRRRASSRSSRQHARPRLHEHDAGRCGIDAAEFV